MLLPTGNRTRTTCLRTEGNCGQTLFHPYGVFSSLFVYGYNNTTPSGLIAKQQT